MSMNQELALAAPAPTQVTQPPQKNGQVVEAGNYAGQELNWDLRASEDNWNKWMKKPPGMMGLGMAYTSRKMKFNVGDYGAMIKDPRMAGPFITSFAVMGRA